MRMDTGPQTWSPHGHMDTAYIIPPAGRAGRVEERLRQQRNGAAAPASSEAGPLASIMGAKRPTPRCELLAARPAPAQCSQP
jgi:hypothetical protein